MAPNDWELKVDAIPALYSKDFTLVEFRDPVTMLGGRVLVQRAASGLLVVSFEELDPGVVALRAIAKPATASQIAETVGHAVAWLEDIHRRIGSTIMVAAKPMEFDGLPELRKLLAQMEKEAMK